MNPITPHAVAPDLSWVVRSVSGPATVGVVLSLALVARLAAGPGAGRRARAWASGLAALGFAAFAAWQLAVLFVLPTGNMDLAVFYRAGREAAAGNDPYLFPGEMVFLSPPPALGVFRLLSALPYAVVGNVWTVASALMAVALVPLSNRFLALEHGDDPEGPPPLPADAAALLGAALVNSNAAVWGLRSGQLCAFTAFALIVALLARRRGRPLTAGACLAVAAFKPATVLAFLALFLRKADRRAWLALVAVSAACVFAAAPPRGWVTLVGHNLRQIGVAGGPGKINDYDFPRAISSDILAFGHAFHRAGLRDRGVIGIAEGAAVVLLLAWIYRARDRRPFAAVASLTATASVLVLYHRLYDAVILALPLAYGSAVALAPGVPARRRVVALASVALLLGVIDQPREALIALTQWTLGRGAVGRLVQAVVLPYATWSLLLAGLGLSHVAFRPNPAAPLGRGTTMGFGNDTTPPSDRPHEEHPALSVIIREKASETVLAEAREMGKDVVNYEGNLYFDPSTVAPGVLKVTERTYTCPVKGVCHWVDFQGADGKTVKDVAWVYHQPKPGHELIKDRYGFYAGSRGQTRQEG